ncbi:MAG: arginase [Bdellovibrionota bacterium]
MTHIVRDIEVIGVPMDLGANIRGANMGPSALRIAGLHQKIGVLGYNVVDRGDVLIPVRETIAPEHAASHYLPVIADICEQVYEKTFEAMEHGRLPLCLGGDHSIAMGSISGVSSYLKTLDQQLGLIWFDAHADINTPETSPSGNIHGMPLAALIGHGHSQFTGLSGRFPTISPKHIALVGIRSIDANERKLCKESGIRYFTMREIDERGMQSVMEEAIRVASAGTSGIHISFDLDAIDPLYAPGVSTPVTGGLSYRESHLALETIADTKKVTSMDFVELNPMTDNKHISGELMVELIQSALGKAII